MNVGRAIALFGYKAAFQGLHVGAAGRALINALGSTQEDIRTIAGMFLVQSGERSLPLLREALANRALLPIVLPILADIGDPSAARDLAPFTGDPDPVIAKTATDAMRVLDANQRMKAEGRS